jgi:hypothetical protein
MRWKMKDPVSRRFVLPLTWLEQVAHDRYRSDPPHALRGIGGRREADDGMAMGHQELDELSADETGGSGHKGGRSRVACHIRSVGDERRRRHAQRPYDARTTPVQMPP